MTAAARGPLPAGPGRGWWQVGAAALLAILMGVGLVVFGPGLLVAAAVVGVIAWLSARPARGLAVFCWLLPFHVVTMAVLYGGLGVPEGIVRALAAWKEALVAACVLAAIVHVVQGRGRITARGLTVTWVDGAVASLVLIAVGHVVVAGPWLGSSLSGIGTAYAFRDVALFLFLYFVGRATGRDVADNDATLSRLFAIGIVTAALGVLEYIFVPPELLAAIGTSRYFSEFLNAGAFTSGNALGLPDNYVDLIGGHLVRRAGSTYLASTGLAAAQVVSIAAASVLLFRRDRPARAWRTIGYIIVWVGLLLSITRMSIVASLAETLIVAFWYRRRGVALGVAASIVGAVIAATALVPGFGAFVWETLTFQSASSVTHVTAWTNAFDIALRHPLGAGLGTTDATAVRFSADEPLTGDNLFFKYSAELGIPAFLLHIAALIGIGHAGWLAARRGRTPARQRLGLAVFVLTIAIFINGTTAVLYNSNFLAYVYFWLAGSAVTVARETGGGIRASA